MSGMDSKQPAIVGCWADSFDAGHDRRSPATKANIRMSEWCFIFF